VSKNFQLVKLVSGNSGSKRITIPREIVKKLGLENTDYVAMRVEGDKKGTFVPAKVVVTE